jgi:hypothetical protein
MLEGGNDWQDVHKDGATLLNVTLILKTADDALIGMTYRGIRHGPPEVIERIEKGEVVDPASYYFRITPMFETAAPKYGWLNHVIAEPMDQFIASSKFWKQQPRSREENIMTVSPNIVCIHGVWAAGSSWSKVTDRC